MNTFWKITRGELDKIFVRPAIFVMTGFFIVAIVISIFMFDPVRRTDLTELANIEGNTVNQVYANFNNNQNKLVFDKKLSDLNTMIEFYSGDDSSTTVTKDDLTTLLTNVENNLNSYATLVKNYTDGSKNAINNAKSTLQNSVKEIITAFNNAFTQNYMSFFITTKGYDSTIKYLNQLNDAVITAGDTESIEYHQRIISNINDRKLLTNLKKNVTAIEAVSLKKEFVLELKQSYYDVAVERTSQIDSEIKALNIKANNSEEINKNVQDINTIKTYADNYKLTIDEAYNLVYDKIMLQIVKGKSNSALSKYYGYDISDFNKYQTKETITRNDYLFANSVYSYEFANVFQSNAISNQKTNAYDFMYYALEFLSFIIVIFCVILGSSMISGETSGGTMRMLAIRPFRRSKILTGKLMATFLIGVIFLIIGALTTFIIGARLYGLSSMPVLVIFNAETATTMSAFALFLIFLLTLLVRIITYTILAVFISTAFKSNIAAIIISIMIYLFVALFGNLFGESVYYGYLPFANVDIFRFLGGEYVSSTGNILGIDFSCPIQPDTNFYISISINIVFVAILLIATYNIFKKRDVE